MGATGGGITNALWKGTVSFLGLSAVIGAGLATINAIGYSTQYRSWRKVCKFQKNKNKYVTLHL